MAQSLGGLVRALQRGDPAAEVLGGEDRGERVALRVAFMSIDDDARQLETFLASQPPGGLSATYWLRDGQERLAWLKEAGFEGEPSFLRTSWSTPPVRSAASSRVRSKTATSATCSRSCAASAAVLELVAAEARRTLTDVIALGGFGVTPRQRPLRRNLLPLRRAWR